MHNYVEIILSYIKDQCKKASALQSLLSGFLWADLSVVVESSSLRRSSDFSVFSRSDSDDSCVDSARNTVVQLIVQLWQDILVVDRSLRQISDSGGLNHVSDGDSLDGLVLWHTLSTVQTSDWLDVASALLVSTVGSSLLWHFSEMVSIKCYFFIENSSSFRKHIFTPHSPTR